MTNEDLIKIGFKPIEHFTIGNRVTYDLNRDRFLSAHSIGTPNEFVWLCEGDDKQASDLVCVHNWDYDGYLTEEKIKGLIYWLEFKNK